MTKSAEVYFVSRSKIILQEVLLATLGNYIRLAEVEGRPLRWIRHEDFVAELSERDATK